MVRLLLTKNRVQIINKGLNVLSRSVTEVQFCSSFFFAILVVAGPSEIGVILLLR